LLAQQQAMGQMPPQNGMPSTGEPQPAGQSPMLPQGENVGMQANPMPQPTQGGNPIQNRQLTSGLGIPPTSQLGKF
jgi:hypothetical protein